MLKNCNVQGSTDLCMLANAIALLLLDKQRCVASDVPGKALEALHVSRIDGKALDRDACH